MDETSVVDPDEVQLTSGYERKRVIVSLELEYAKSIQYPLYFKPNEMTLFGKTGLGV